MYFVRLLWCCKVLKRVANMTEAEYLQMLDKSLVLKDKYSEENIANNFIREFNDIIASEK